MKKNRLIHPPYGYRVYLETKKKNDKTKGGKQNGS